MSRTSRTIGAAGPAGPDRGGRRLGRSPRGTAPIRRPSDQASIPQAAPPQPAHKKPPARARGRQAHTKPRLELSGRGQPIVWLRHGARIPIRTAPGGKVVKTLGWRTPFGSRTVLAVFRHHGAWAGVPTPLLPNGELGWVKLDPSRLRAGWTRYTIDVDLSSRAAQLRRGDRVLRSFTVTVGAPGTTHPDRALRDHRHLRGNLEPRLRLLRAGHHRDPAAPALRVVRRRPDRDPRHLRAARHRRLARLRAGRGPEREPARQPGPARVAGASSGSRRLG